MADHAQIHGIGYEPHDSFITVPPLTIYKQTAARKQIMEQENWLGTKDVR